MAMNFPAASSSSSSNLQSLSSSSSLATLADLPAETAAVVDPRRPRQLGWTIDEGEDV